MNTVPESSIVEIADLKASSCRSRRRAGRSPVQMGVGCCVVAVALIGYAGASLAGIVLPRGVIQVEAEPASARVALVIGNGAYMHVEHGEDHNARNDAAGVGAALERLGFTVTLLEDAGYTDMHRGLLEFSQAAELAQAAVVFYAGQGYVARDRNFLIPVDTSQAAFNAADEGDLHATEGNPGWIPVKWVMRSVDGASNLRVEDASKLRLVILDTDVLAPLEPAGETIVALAAAEGTNALMGSPESDHSPYTEALLRYLEEPGLELGMLLRKVRGEVMRSTEGSQVPAAYGLPGREVYLAPISDPPPISAPPDPTGEASVR